MLQEPEPSPVTGMVQETTETSAPAAPPNPPRKTAWQQILLIPAIAVVAGALGWWLGSTQLMVLLEAKSYDLRFLMRSSLPGWLAPQRETGPVTLVMIDATTDDLLQKPRQFWPAEFGQVLEAAAQGGAKAVGLDWYFTYPITRWDEAADMEFFKSYMSATQSGTPVIMAYEKIEPARKSEAFVPVYMQAVAEGHIGYAQIRQDDDTFIRKIELLTQDGRFAALSGRVAAAFLRSALEKTPNGLRIGERQIPQVEDRTMRIHYYGPRRKAFPVHLMAEVLQAFRKHDRAQLRKWFQGRAVLIGPDDIQDRHPTPFSAGQGDLVEGVEIHAHAVSTILNGDFLREVNAQPQLALVMGAAFLAAWAGFRLRWNYSLGIAVAVMAGIFYLVLIAHAHGWVLSLVRPELAVIFATVGSNGIRTLTLDRRKRLLENTFSSFVSREVLGSIVEAGGVPLRGDRREVTVMFSDIRDFTTYCEGRKPQEVVEELNEYFGEMAESIIRHGGMLNKYIGDGIMALFGAPVPHADHADRAVRCALDMRTRNLALNARRQARGLQELRIGVGIHTGEVVVGNIGAQDKKMEYTAMGDTVNVASRIEGLNKDFKTDILLSLSTRERMGVDLVSKFKGYQKVKGRAEEVAVYTIE